MKHQFYRLPSHCLMALLVLAFASSTTAAAKDSITARYPELRQAGYQVGWNNDHSQAEAIPFVPASTVKIITAWLALEHWGAEHRFQTDFYLHKTDAGITLWVRGSGDPFLVSDEIRKVAGELRKRNLPALTGIGLDSSLFEQGLVLPGTGQSNNPYDAVPSALAANFNTINVHKRGARIHSAEPETPLTASATQRAANLRNGKHRVNLGGQPATAIRYFGELLRAMLLEQGVTVRSHLRLSAMPAALSKQKPFYTHQNSRTLSEIVKPMLEYSTNFVANQLVLMLAAEHFNQPANAQRVHQYMHLKLRQFGIQGQFHLADGAGLARSNRLSPRQLTWVLKNFQPWKHTLPQVATKLFAKSGTLRGVTTLAGFRVNQGNWQPFVLMIPKSISAHQRNAIAIALTNPSD